MPWGVIMMVAGVTTLVTLLDRTGGMALFADFLGTSRHAGDVDRRGGVLLRGDLDLQQHDWRRAAGAAADRFPA